MNLSHALIGGEGNWETRNYSATSFKSSFSLLRGIEEFMHIPFLWNNAVLFAYYLLDISGFPELWIWRCIFIQWAFVDCLLCARMSSRATEKKSHASASAFVFCMNEGKCLLSYPRSVCVLLCYYLRGAYSWGPVSGESTPTLHTLASFQLTHHY